MTDHRAQRDTLVAKPRARGPRVVLVVVLAVVVFAGLAAYGEARALARHLSAYAWEHFAAALALTLGNYALRLVRWEYYLRRLDVRVPGAESALVFFSGFAVSVTPGKLGEVFKSFLLHDRRGVSVVRTAPVVVAERLTDLVALVALTAFGALSFTGGWVVAGVGAAGVAVLLAACAWRPLGGALLAISERIPGVRRLAPRLREAYAALWTMTRPRPLLVGTGLATLAWAFEVAALHVVLTGFSPPVPLDPWATSFAYAAPTIAGAAALLPGGLGVTEAGMTALLQELGGGRIDRTVATAATLLVRLATLWFAVLLGALALAALRLRPPAVAQPLRE